MKAVIKRGLIALLGPDRFEGLAGYMMYRLLRKDFTNQFGGPLNGSQVRQETVREISRSCAIRAIVETGTYCGDSCAFLAETGVPVHSVELHPRWYAFARARLAGVPNVHLQRGDSRGFLKKLTVNPAVPRENVLFYLDAHWFDDLPLRDEVGIILGHWKNAVIVVDDFQVPDDPGYKFDDYGGEKVLALRYLTPIVHLGFRVFFPAVPSDQEIGIKRGWVVLARDEAVTARLRSIEALREWQGTWD